MTENIHKKNLAELAKKIGITVKAGWKTELATRLKQKRVNNISFWLQKGPPRDFHHILENAGVDPEIWREIVEGPWIQGVFYRNIQRIIDDFCGGIGAVFDEKIGSPYAGIRWKTERPSHDSIAAVVMQFGVNRQWLLTGQGEMMASTPASHPLSISSPQSDHINSILGKVAYVIEHGDERAKLALEYGVEGVYSRVSRQVEVMDELAKQIRIMNDQQARHHKELVSLLKRDSEKKAATGS